MKSKKAEFDLPFGVIFSIIAGAVIIFIAIFAAVSFANIGKHTQYSEAAQRISSILDPVVNGIASGYSQRVDFKRDTRIYLTCNERTSLSSFGRQGISFAEESGIVKKWQKPGAEIQRYNKYIFGENMSEGRTLYILSKPFYAGFSVDDIVLLGFEKYCFIAAPERIQEELEVSFGNINFSSRIDLCPKNTKTVCFGSSFNGCNISVLGKCDNNYCEDDYSMGSVAKNGKTMYYFGNLIYAAIFSTPDIYECNIRRLGFKTSQLAEVYSGKIEAVKIKDCNSLLDLPLGEIKTIIGGLNSSQKFIELYEKSKAMDEIACEEDCKIYYPEKC